MNTPLLKICFLLRIRERFYSESSIVEHLDEIMKASKNAMIDLSVVEGAVSINYNGEELLGIEFWDVIDRMFIAPDALLNGSGRAIYLPYQSFTIKLQPNGDTLLYQAQSLSPKRFWNTERILPRDMFIQQWTLMYFRYLKLLAYLDSESAQQTVVGWRSFMSQKWRESVGEEKMQQLIDEDLHALLLGSDCNGL